MLLTVAVTAILIHLTWFYNARRNVADVVGQLNRQIVGSVQHEVRGTLNDAWSVQEAVQSIFFQEAIKPTDEAKREFIFLALLRSHPTLSWIALGFPDGAFFGALRAADDEIDMVEVKRDPETGIRQQRVDTYTPEPGDVMFLGRKITPSDYEATAQPWYRRAVAENGPGWSMLSHLPYRDRPAIVTSTPIVINLDFAGVVAVVVELDRLSQFLASLQVGKTGTVVLLDRSDRVVASAASAALKRQRQGEMPELKTLARDHPMLASVGALLRGSSLSLADLRETRQLQTTGPIDGKDYFVTFSPLNFNNWVVATVIPASDFLASIQRSAMILLIALAGLTLMVAAIAILSANRLVAAPLLRIAGQLKHIQDFQLDRVVRLASPLREIDDLSGVLLQMSRGLASFQKYMPTELVRMLVSQGVEPEYPVSWLDPLAAAWLGEAVEIVCPPLLVFGLATRFAALPMLILSLVIQFSYQALDQHLFWAILFGWFVIKGAGPISLDALIGRGIAATALPLAGRITRVFEALSRRGDPSIKLLLRCWIAALFFRSGVMKISNFDMTQMLFHARSTQWLLPPELAARLTILLELACLIFLVLGVGTRITAILLIGLIAFVDPTFQHQIDLAYYLMVLGLTALYGPGAFSLDSLVVRTLLQRFPQFDGMRTVSYEGTPRVVIVGGGFGGVATAKSLRNTRCRVTLIDQRNYYLFQPLLYQVATADLSPADIAGPIRGLFRDQPNVRVLLGGVTGVDLERAR